MFLHGQQTHAYRLLLACNLSNLSNDRWGRQTDHGKADGISHNHFCSCPSQNIQAIKWTKVYMALSKSFDGWELRVVRQWQAKVKVRLQAWCTTSSFDLHHIFCLRSCLLSFLFLLAFASWCYLSDSFIQHLPKYFLKFSAQRTWNY